MVCFVVYISLDIEVTIIPYEDDDYEIVTEETRHFMSNFDPTVVLHIDSTSEGVDGYGDAEKLYQVQDQLFRSVRQGVDGEGLKIEVPEINKQLRAYPVMYFACVHFISLELDHCRYVINP